MGMLSMSKLMTVEEVDVWSVVLVELEEWRGVYYCSIRGLARILGVSVSTFTDGRVSKGRPRGLLWRLMLCSEEELPESLRSLAGFNYQEVPAVNGKARMLPQPVIEGLVKYYAFDCLEIKERAVLLVGILDALWG